MNTPTVEERAEQAIWDAANADSETRIQIHGRAIRAAVEAEREACAMLVQKYDIWDLEYGKKHGGSVNVMNMREELSRQIRSRGEEEKSDAMS